VDNAVTRTASVAFLAPPAATPSFDVNPASPQRFELTTLDASATRLDGQPCPDTACTYSWQIGSEANLTGMVVTYRFQQQQSYVIVLRVTAPSGIVTQTQRTITVNAAPAPVPDITASPTSPLRNQTVILSGAGSTASNGATIVEYTWDFGNGSTGNGVSATTSYSVDGTYTVRLTVRDSNGLTATRTTTITVRP
jgi:PKD repeat protein